MLVFLLRQPRAQPIFVVGIHDGQTQQFPDHVRRQTYGGTCVSMYKK